MNIFENFSQKEFTDALQQIKPGKSPGPDFISPKLIIHVGAALKSWLRNFLSFFLLAPTQNVLDLERSACSRAFKADKYRSEPKELSTDISAL